MQILFTKSNSLLSTWIRELTDEPVSHVVLQIGDFIFHSNLIGVHIDWAPKFYNDCEIIYKLERRKDSPNQRKEDKTRTGNLLDQYEWSFYDFGALMFLGLCYVGHKYLKMKAPKRNLWQSSGAFICTEWVTEDIEGAPDSVISPYELYLKLKDSKNWIDV